MMAVKIKVYQNNSRLSGVRIIFHMKKQLNNHVCLLNILSIRIVLLFLRQHNISLMKIKKFHIRESRALYPRKYIK